MKQNKHPASPSGKLAYPAARRSSDTDTLWGTTVPDPYRWLEDEGSQETRTWLDAQAQLTQAYFSRLATRDALRRRLKKLLGYKTRSAPWTRGANTFFWGNDGTQSFDTLYVQTPPDRKPRVLFDANLLSDDASIYLSGLSVSWDGKYLAYGLTSCGSDWVTWGVRAVAGGKDLPEQLEWIRFSGAAWAADSSGFFYCRYPEPTDRKAPPAHQKIYFHKLGTPQRQDPLVYERPDRKYWRFGLHTTEDGLYLVITVYPSASGNTKIFYQDLKTKEVVKLLDSGKDRWSFINNDGPRFWLLTSEGATRGRVVAVDVRKQPLVLEEVIPENRDKHVVFSDVAVIGNRFFVSYSRHAQTFVEERLLDGTLVGNLKLPGSGTASGFEGRRTDTTMYYYFTNYATPATTYCYDIASGRSSLSFKPKVAVDCSRYVTKLLFVESNDGTQVPMFVSYRKGLKRNGKNPTLMYGYGGFGKGLYPSYSSPVIAWMDLGGVYAAACIRGGGEYGTDWHDGGSGLRKRNGFNDFIACAERLIQLDYTSEAKLAMLGQSNGGLLVGACMTQRPGLWAAAVPGVGVMDMIRFHRFTAGREWLMEYGCAENSQKEFKALFAYSPYHRLRPGTGYPATLVTCASHDDRVDSFHSRKFTAALQACQGSEKPCLLRVEAQAGHFGASGLAQQIEAFADIFAFLIEELGIPAAKLRRLTD